MSITRDAALQPLENGTPRYETGAGFLLARLGTMAERNWNSFINDVGLTQTQFTILTVLGEGDRLRQRDLAARASIDARNAVPVIARLTTRGLVRAETDPSDRRAKMLRISGEGAKLVSRITDRLRDERSDFFSPLAPAEYAQLCELLGRVYRSRIDGT